MDQPGPGSDHVGAAARLRGCRFTYRESDVQRDGDEPVPPPKGHDTAIYPCWCQHGRPNSCMGQRVSAASNVALSPPFMVCPTAAARHVQNPLIVGVLLVANHGDVDADVMLT